MSLNNGECKHGIPLAEPCLLCGVSGKKTTTLPKPGSHKPKRSVRLPATFDEDVEILVRILETAGTYRTATSVSAALTNATEADARFTRDYVRHLAKGSRGRVLSGQKGYKATKRANVDEVQESAAALLKAAKGTMLRRREILKAFYGENADKMERKHDAKG